MRRRGDVGRRELGTFRHRQGGPRPAGHHALDADRHPSGQAVRVRPAAAGPDRPVPVFGLPGNPVSSLVSFELLARPALRQMMGHQHLDRPRVRAHRRRRLPPPSRRQDALEPGHRPVRGRRALPRQARRAARAATSWPRRPRRTDWPRCRTATASLPGGDVDVLLLT